MCEEYIKRYHEKGIINYLGQVRDILEILRDIDVAVLASYREGMPRFLLEAAACEKPIITTNVPGCRDVVEHGVNGLIVPPKNAYALAEAIRHLSLHPEQCSEMGKQGRKKILSQFDETIIIKETLDIYKTLLQPIVGIN
ncbi:MAG: glycosyltransferase [Candidatus Omnitrophica bacterium]|nr:glycosyltransferase [Candidatus Omnitrophota bacterium]